MSLPQLGFEGRCLVKIDILPQEEIPQEKMAAPIDNVLMEKIYKAIKDHGEVLKKMESRLSKLEESKLKKPVHVEINEEEEKEEWDERDQADYQRKKQLEKLAAEFVAMKEKPNVVIEEIREKVNWIDYMDAKVMEAMLKVKRDVLAITIEKPSDPITFFMPTDGHFSNQTWVGFTKNIGEIPCNVSSDVLFNIFNKMNSVFAYFDVSHNIEILHLNDSNEFENEINKQLEKKIEPMEPILETLNMDNDENPCLIKIGSTLNEQEKKDLKEFLTKFQEVFAWSYKDMPGIDPEIAQHHIDTNPSWYLSSKSWGA